MLHYLVYQSLVNLSKHRLVPYQTIRDEEINNILTSLEFNKNAITFNIKNRYSIRIIRLSQGDYVK